MFLTKYSVLLIVIISLECSNGKPINNAKTVPNGKQNGIPSVRSRFFDLSGILGQLFPGFNQGIQEGSAGNPGGIGFPSDSQFYPAGPSQTSNLPPSFIQGGGNYPVIDDASQYPYRGQNPNNNFGGGTQIPNPINNVQYPSQVGVGGLPFPDQGNFGNYPQGQNPPIQYPGFPGNPSVIENPIKGDQWNHNGQNGNPIQGGQWNQNGQAGFGPGSGSISDGTLDGLMPPQDPHDVTPPDVFDSNNQNGQPGQPDLGGSGTNAILGRPVIVPTDKTPDDGIVFPKSTESPAQKQCVQDCQTSSEYSPVCGTDNITYFNPGRFVCARNCGINVFVLRQGRCDVNGL